MARTAAAPPATPRTLGLTVLCVVAVTGAVTATVVDRQAPSPARVFGQAPLVDHGGAAVPDGRTVPGDDGVVTEDDGALPDGVTVSDDGFPGVARLDPALLRALRRAAGDAAGDGVRFVVTSGWRSARYQEQLRAEAVSRYGSQEEAARWVATADTSAHVSGDAVDIGPAGAREWLAEHGARYGLCQTYRNEPWHYELRPEAVGRACPPAYADPAQDPRMRR